VPPDHRVYAIGDIHGRRDLLDALLDQIEKDCLGTPQTIILVFLGDYVDRGPDSKGVIDRLLTLPARFEKKVLRGNHDQALLDFLADAAAYESWCDFGADETLISYGVRPPRNHSLSTFGDARDRFAAALPADHLHFLQTLPLSWEFGDYFFAHAGVRPGAPLNEQKEDDLLWIREEFLNSSEDFGKVVVHGHTPTDSPVKRTNRIGVDTGAYLTGRLTAVVLEGQSQRFLQTG
jgi:serine/threonine protein phosphatase 1